MKLKFALCLSSIVAMATAQASLYYDGSEAQESLPLTWSVGATFTWDDNVAPGRAAKDDSTAITPYVGLSMVTITPQTTWDIYARAGFTYYFDAPSGLDDTYGQIRVGANISHDVDARLRLTSRNFLSYELEPDYSFGYATNRTLGEYLLWRTDNAVGYRWSERLGSYTGFNVTRLDYSDVSSQDRTTWGVYHQMRYTLDQRTVVTGEYRYANTTASGFASDSDSHYLLAGVEHRINPTSIVVARAGAQFRDSDRGSSSTHPFLEAAFNTRPNQQLSLRTFARFGAEPYDNVRMVGNALYDFDERETFRLGISGNYAISQQLSIFSGIDYIPSSFDAGRQVAGFGPATRSGLSEDIFNIYVGVGMQLTEYLHGSLSYNFTDVDSDFANSSYDRNRVSLSLRAEF